MKLNTIQINALAKKFYDEKQKEYDKANDEYKKKQLEKYRENYNKGMKILKDNPFINYITINVSRTDYATLQRNWSFEQYTNNYNIIHNFTKKNQSLSLIDIKNDIVIATIDAKSTEEIMNNLKLKYK